VRLLIEFSSAFELLFVGRIIVDILLRIVGDTEIDTDPGYKRDSMGFFLEGFVIDTESTHTVQVNGNGHNLHVSQLEGLRQLLHLSVLTENAAAVEIVSSA
jgi:hypothetical protein